MTEKVIDSFGKKEDAIDDGEEEFGVVFVRDCFSEMGHILLRFRGEEGFVGLVDSDVFYGTGIPREKVKNCLSVLKKRGLLTRDEEGVNRLTEPGEVNAEILFEYKNYSVE